jgi:excisionase family DNA binding protein
MPYKLNKIIFQRDYSWGYETYTYDLNAEIDFPYVAGMLQELVPKDKSQIRKYKPEISDDLLFNEKGLTKLIPEVGPKGIYYLELRPSYKLKQLFVEPDDVVVDIFIGSEETLIYSFYNPTRRNFISINASLEKDKENVFTKIKSDLTNIYWRRYFIRRALYDTDVTMSDSKISENMTAAEVAKYLNLGNKTIRNWTSEGKIPFVKLGSSVRYPKERIDNWIKSKEKKSKNKHASK